MMALGFEDRRVMRGIPAHPPTWKDTQSLTLVISDIPTQRQKPMEEEE